MTGKASSASALMGTPAAARGLTFSPASGQGDDRAAVEEIVFTQRIEKARAPPRQATPITIQVT